MARYLAEFIGTFFLVLVIGATVMSGNPGIIAPLAIGAALMAMVYANGHVSSAHFNPAVTLAFWIRGRMQTKDVGPYLFAQIAGASAGALIACYLRPVASVMAMSIDIPRALTAEFLFTFALAYVVLNVATARGTNGNSFYGLAIGFTVLGGAFAVGDISGGAFNPAVAVGVSAMGLSSWANLWVYVVAEAAGAALAAVVFKLMNPDDV